MKKNLILVIAWLGFVAYAQNSEEEQIQLPELTTTVSGDTVVAGKDAVPDFSKVVPSAGEEKNIMPRLPGERISGEDGDGEPEASFLAGEHKNVYAQGLVGGGFPGDFIGDFSVYKASETDPFRIEFSHFSRNGYGKNPAGKGYFDNGTKLYAEKTFQAISSDFTVSGKYDRSGTGLQERSSCFYDMNSQKVCGNLIFDHVFSDTGFEFYSESECYWFNRYTGINNEGKYLKQEQDIDVIHMDPGFVFSWYNQGFSAAFECNFQIESILGSLEMVDTKRIFRVDGALVTGFENDIVTAFAQGGIAGGNKIGDGRSIVPSFSTGAEVRVKFGEAERNFVIGLNGGLRSKHEELSVLERTYKFAQLTTLTDETSDWFVNSKIVIPMFETVSLNGNVEFKKTAFDNGVWEAAYSSRKESGLYGIAPVDRTLFTTDAGLSFKMGVFTMRGGWRAHWKHVPSNEYEHTVETSISYDSENEKWGFSAGAVESIDDSSDKCPNIKGSIYCNVKNVMKLSLEIDDAVKLISRKERKYVDSEYLARAGSVTFLAKFFF